ncbi:MAG: polysaccharide biosynthesis/export family protein [Saprospiraceae bacterium]|nr:polysaccharide biosynthesis/export family protein [Saprospiraceae bacterium]
MQQQISAIDSLPVLTIQSDDILNIQVSSRNPEPILAFQSGRSDVGGSGERALGTQDGYRVDDEGNLYLPYLGQVKAEGKTVLQLRNEIAERLVAFFNDATVQVRFVNFRVTLMGEVVRPNAYVIPNERINILEAIGMAGDFTSYARRDSVTIIRERNQVREFVQLNTQDTSLFHSPYFYLRPNDIVYVEPLKAKQYATQGDFLQRYSNIIYPLVTLVTFIVGISIK